MLREKEFGYFATIHISATGLVAPKNSESKRVILETVEVRDKVSDH